MRYLLLICSAVLIAACDPGPAPPAGTYQLELTGTRTTVNSASDPGTSEPYTISSTVVLYVDEGANGADLEYTFYSIGLTAPSEGRLAEMRLFPSIFVEDTSTTTLAGVFFQDEDADRVEAIGQAIGGGNNVMVQFPDVEEPTLCAYYERYRLNYLLGSWAQEHVALSLDTLYEDTCLLADGTPIRNGYPHIEYNMQGSMDLLYTLPTGEQGEGVSP